MQNLLPRNSLALGLLFGLTFLPIRVAAQPHGVVDYTLQWGTSRQRVIYVFTGTVTCDGLPCPAEVTVNLVLGSDAGIVQEAKADADGKYRMELASDATPEDSAEWKIVARPPLDHDSQTVELAGRVIFLEDQDTVVVQRPIELVHG